MTQTKRTPKYSQFSTQGAYISATTTINGAVPFLEKTLQTAFSQTFPPPVSYGAIWLISHVPNHIKSAVKDCFKAEFSNNPDAYAIVADTDIRIYSNSERGLMYGVYDLIRLAEDGHFKKGIIYEAPVCAVRGAKVYLPGRSGIPYFLEYIDFLAEFRFNTLMIEIGGAMEYKRHPEINEGWVEYCKEIAEYSGKASDIQDTIYPWTKNSIHVENGDGGFITQEETRQIIEYCRKRYIDIIPEVPSFSHCDYLLIRHPEIRERSNDDYADTYCPSNEKSYELLFDVLDEIIDVFQPMMINIGHDEAYTIGVCPKCETKDPVQIYADDIKRIYDYLKTKSVKTMVWAEKFLNAKTAEGPQGGAEKFIHYHTKKPFEKPIPATYPAIDLVPCDLEMLHWYWSLDEAYDDEYLKRGLPTTYGNFNPSGFKNWRKRMDKGIKGGIISNWSSIKEENVQRNGMLYQIAFGNQLFWEDDYSEDMAINFQQVAFQELYDFKYRNLKGEGIIKITHSTSFHLDYQQFYDGVFIVHEEYDLGYYKVSYDDGTYAALPIEYGRNIGSLKQAWDLNNPKLAEVAYSTLPIKTHDGIVYETMYKNPHPDKEITAINYVPNPRKDAVVAIHKFEAIKADSAANSFVHQVEVRKEILY